MIKKEIVEQIKSRAKIEEVAADFLTLKKAGTSLLAKCPECGIEGKGKGLSISPKKQIYKCFSCGYTGVSPINFVMERKLCSYPEALKVLADKYQITINEDPEPIGPQRKVKKGPKPYRDVQLEASGLSAKDITINAWVDDKTVKRAEVYQSGTRDQFYRIVPGDDMIIWYYDLEGKPVLYKKPKSSQFEHLYRVRWQIPENHPDKYGRPIKYQSPSGSGSHLFIPEPVRQAYKDQRIIKRLFIQEGEKKADKACKHGIMSVGIMGIHNIAQQGHLPHDLQTIVQTCQVQEVIFVLDSDWNQLSNNLKPGDRVDLRTASFYKAVINYRDYFKAFNNIGIYLELYFGYIKENEKKDKGIDDLLTNTLKDNELELRSDFDRAVNDIKEKNGEGKYIQLHKITTLSDPQIMQFWGFDDKKTFLKTYKDYLLECFPNGEVFKVGNVEWRWDDDKKNFVPAQDITENEQYWEEIVWEDARGNEKKKLQFDYVNLKKFLRSRGYGKIRMVNGKYLFAKVEGKVVSNIEASEIKDYVVEFTEEIAPKNVQQLILRGAKMYLGPESLGNMYKSEPIFSKPAKEYQCLYFKDKFWKVSEKLIDEKPLNQLQNFIWSDKIIDFNATKIDKPLVSIDKVTQKLVNSFPEEKQAEFSRLIGQYEVELTPEGEKCDFLKFLHNTSEFAWRKMIDPKTRKPLAEDTRTLDEKFETSMHLLSKLTTIGYLLHDYQDKSLAKMVICMDGRLSEVGKSNGRSGKSIFGFFIGKIIPQVYIGGKQKKLTEDPFLMEGVNEKTKNVFIDDTRTNIDIEFFYPHITGQFAVRPLGEKRFYLPEDEKPKILATTNHGVNDGGGSFRDRVMMLAFSDFYNENHKPVNDFGCNFFDDWDTGQWNITFNLAATCLQLYFKYGLVVAPLRRLELRNLRQKMGETFLTWAETYFSDQKNINARIPRKEINDAYEEAVPSAKRYGTPNSFSEKLTAYCEYSGYRLNPKLYDENGVPRKYDNKGKPIVHDKSGGIEYFTIADDSYNEI